VISAGAAWSIAGLMADFSGAMLLMWPMISSRQIRSPL